MSLAIPMNDELRVLGATIHGFARACVDLNVVAGAPTIRVLEGIDINGWYPFQRLRDIEGMVLRSYEDAAPILERVGIEMMTSWYSPGPGKSLIGSGIDFLRFQTGSKGYASVVQGPEALVGSFRLIRLDEDGRTALIHSTTPFNKDLERGVILGGMLAPGDLDFVDVKNEGDPQRFEVSF